MIMQAGYPNGETVTAAVPDHRELKRATLGGIIAQPHLTRALFE